MADGLTAPEVARVEKAAIPLLRGKCLVLIDILLLERSDHPCDLLLRALVGILKALTAPTASTMQVDQPGHVHAKNSYSGSGNGNGNGTVCFHIIRNLETMHD